MDDVTLSELFDTDSATSDAPELAVSPLPDTDESRVYTELADEMVSLTGAMFGLLLPGHEQDAEPQLSSAEPQTPTPAGNGAGPAEELDMVVDQIDVPELVSLEPIELEPIELEPIELEPIVPDLEPVPVVSVDSVPVQPTAKSMTLLQEIAFLDD